MTAPLRTRRAGVTALVLALLVAAGLALAYAASRPAPLDRRVASVAAGLRCPTCAGQSVADSEAPMARSMRDVVRQQLAAGRTAGEVRAWFAARYGPDILLDPPARGPGILLVAGPVVLLGLGSALALRAVRGRPTVSRGPGVRRVAGATAVVAGLAVAGVWGMHIAAAPHVPAAAAAAPAAATSGASLEDSRIQEALAALRAKDFAGAQRLARAVLADVPDQPDALLVLGLAQRVTGSAEATGTLQRFLAVAPTSAAAPEVRQYLAGIGKH